MKIDEMKSVFIGLLQAYVETNEAEKETEEYIKIYLNEKVLEENNLNKSTFWDVICPLLKKESILKNYNFPDGFGSDFSESLLKNPEYATLLNKLMNGEDSKAIISKLDEIKERLRKNFTHTFVVNEKKVLQTKNKTDKKKIAVYVDTKRGLYMERDGHNLFYPRMKPTSKIFKMILFMMKGEVFSLKQLCEHTHQGGKVIKSSIGRFNDNFPRIFGTNGIPIRSSEVGYELNKEYYDFI